MTKTQSDYAPHDHDNLIDGWNAVSEYAENCVLIAFDGCHKIYLAMDETEATFFRNPDNYEFSFENNGKNDLVDILDDWFRNSCDLKFIQAVWSNEADPNSGFTSLISQMAEEVDEELYGHHKKDASDDEDDEY